MLDFLVVWDLGRESEIDELQIHVFVQEDIFQFDVSVGDADGVTVLKSRNDLEIEPSGFVFGESFIGLGLQVRVERAVAHIFHDEENLLSGLDHFVEFDYMFMFHSFHEFDLSFHALAPLRL